MDWVASYANLFPTGRSLVQDMNLAWVARYVILLLVFILISWGLRFFIFQGMREKVAKREGPKKKNKFFRVMREKAAKRKEKEKEKRNRRYRKM